MVAVISIDPAFNVEGQGNGLVFVVTLSEPSVNTVTVQFRTVPGTASQGIDYNQSVGTLTFAPGQTSATITVNDATDGALEVDEFFTLELINPVGAVLAGGAPVLQATGTMRDDDGPTVDDLAFFVSSPVIVEGDAGTKVATFEVRLSQPAPSSITATYATADGSASAGSDYVAASGSLTWAPGEEVKFVSVTVNGDANIEASELFSLVLTQTAGVTVNTAAAAGEATILDDDASATLPTITVAPTWNTEGAGNGLVFVVTLSEPSVNTVTVQFRTVPGTASQGIDYNQSVGTLTFAPGQTSATITVNDATDGALEVDEFFTLELINPVGAVLAGGAPVLQATGTMRDDDGPTVDDLAFFVSSPVIVEGDAGTKVATFEVRLSQPAPSSITATYATADGSASAGSDYVAASGSLTWAPGEEVKFVSVTVNGDAEVELDETFTLSLSYSGISPVISTAGATGTATLRADDFAPTNIDLSSTTVLEFRANGTIVGALSATDADAGDTFTYELVNNGGGRFAISGSNLVVADGLRLDFEQFSSHAISVRVTDSGGAMFTKSFTINVGDVTPEFVTGDAAQNMFVGGAGNDTLNGGGNDDMLFGGDGNDSLLGGTGNDDMTGGAGNDTYNVDSLLDIVRESVGLGTQDTIVSTVNVRLDTTTTAQGVEHIALQGTAGLTAVGTSVFNIINGNSGANYLAGNGGNDSISGAVGNDRVQGGDGKDTLTGGLGDDAFLYTFIADSGGTQPRRDVITDFGQVAGNNDWIDLALTDANGALAGNQVFVWRGTAAFTGAAGELRYFQDVANNRTIIEGNVRIDAGSPGPEFSIELMGLKTLTAGASNAFDIIL